MAPKAVESLRTLSRRVNGAARKKAEVHLFNGEARMSVWATRATTDRAESDGQLLLKLYQGGALIAILRNPEGWEVYE